MEIEEEDKRKRLKMKRMIEEQSHLQKWRGTNEAAEDKIEKEDGQRNLERHEKKQVSDREKTNRGDRGLENGREEWQCVEGEKEWKKREGRRKGDEEEKGRRGEEEGWDG